MSHTSYLIARMHVFHVYVYCFGCSFCCCFILLIRAHGTIDWSMRSRVFIDIERVCKYLKACLPSFWRVHTVCASIKMQAKKKEWTKQHEKKNNIHTTQTHVETNADLIYVHLTIEAKWETNQASQANIYIVIRHHSIKCNWMAW